MADDQAQTYLPAARAQADEERVRTEAWREARTATRLAALGDEDLRLLDALVRLQTAGLLVGGDGTGCGAVVSREALPLLIAARVGGRL